VPDLRTLERLTGGSAKTGAMGRKLDRRIFVPGPTQRRFESALTGLEACGTTLKGSLPAAPTTRLRPVRQTLVHACAQLERVPALLRDEVEAASSPAKVDPGALTSAAVSAQEGVRGIVDGLASVRRVLGVSKG